MDLTERVKLLIGDLVLRNLKLEADLETKNARPDNPPQ